MKTAIEQEIEWHENHKGESGKGELYEDGFLAGLRHIKNILGKQPAPGLVQDVNSLANIVIQASGQGYVSSNDLDFANDCLDKVIPLLKPAAGKA